MTEERINAIEHAIAAAEHRGDRWTNQTIFAVVGGRYGDLSQYLGFPGVSAGKGAVSRW